MSISPNILVKSTGINRNSSQNICRINRYRQENSYTCPINTNISLCTVKISLNQLVKEIGIDRQLHLPIAAGNRYRSATPPTYWQTNSHNQEIGYCPGCVGAVICRIQDWGVIHANTKAVSRYDVRPARKGPGIWYTIGFELYQQSKHIARCFWTTKLDQIDRIDHEVDQIDHELDQIDHELHQMDHELDHLDLSLPLWDVQDLYSTDPTQQTVPR